MLKKIFRQMLITQIVSAMTVMICMMIDSMMIGRFLGVDSITAYGLASPVLLVFAAFGSMLSAGIQVMCGKTMGSGDMEGTNACYTASAIFAGAFSLLGVVLVLVFISPLTRLLGAEPGTEVFRLTADYLKGFIIGAPAFIIAQIMVPYMQISGNRIRLVVAVLMMTVSDIVFDILNVFVFKWGTLGMGLASSFSYYIAFIIGIIYFFKKSCMFKFRISLVKRRLFTQLIHYGLPTVINQLSIVLLVFVFNKMLLDVHPGVGVAAFSVISTVGNFCYCFGSGAGSVALLLASIFYTDEDRSSLRSLVKIMTYYAVILDVVIIALVLLAAPLLIALFITSDNPEVVKTATLGARLFSLSLLSSALNAVLKNYFQGVEHTRFSELISFMQNFALTALSAFILSRFLGSTGVWLGYLCGETLTLIVIFIVVSVKYKKISCSADAFTMLPESFGVPDSDLFETSVKNSDQAVEASRQVFEFCKSHGKSGKNSTFISLCVEEMVNNIVEHGFTKGGKDHSIDLRIVFKGEGSVIRIRDNCVNFDPVKYVELHKSDDPVAHIGIRMVMRMVKNANYVNSLGLNNLTLVL